MMMLNAFKKAEQQLIANTSMSATESMKKKGKDTLFVKNGITYTVSGGNTSK